MCRLYKILIHITAIPIHQSFKPSRYYCDGVELVGPSPLSNLHPLVRNWLYVVVVGDSLPLWLIVDDLSTECPKSSSLTSHPTMIRLWARQRKRFPESDLNSVIKYLSSVVGSNDYRIFNLFKLYYYFHVSFGEIRCVCVVNIRILVWRSVGLNSYQARSFCQHCWPNRCIYCILHSVNT